MFVPSLFGLVITVKPLLLMPFQLSLFMTKSDIFATSYSDLSLENKLLLDFNFVKASHLVGNGISCEKEKLPINKVNINRPTFDTNLFFKFVIVYNFW